MTIAPVFFAALPIVSTLLGGLAVYYWKKDLHPWLSLSGGVLLAVAFLDLFPEALATASEVGVSIKVITGIALASILLFHLLDKTLSIHAHHEHADHDASEPCDNAKHQKNKAWIRASSMILHSFMDGFAIGGGFVIDYRLGLIVTLAVIMHDFSDGMSTVTILRHGLGKKQGSILPLLVADALAPFVGALVGTRLAPSGNLIAYMLAFFSGFFIFLSLSELLPQAHAGTMSRRFGLFLTTIGVLLVVLIQSVANI